MDQERRVIMRKSKAKKTIQENCSKTVKNQLVFLQERVESLETTLEIILNHIRGKND